MSIESAKAFIERMKSDAAFRKSVNGASDPEALVKEAGFDFTKEELREVREEIGQELSDEALRDVAGGADPTRRECSMY